MTNKEATGSLTQQLKNAELAIAALDALHEATRERLGIDEGLGNQFEPVELHEPTEAEREWEAFLAQERVIRLGLEIARRDTEIALVTSK